MLKRYDPLADAGPAFFSDFAESDEDKREPVDDACVGEHSDLSRRSVAVELLNKIRDRSAVGAVFGLGHVGLPLLRAMAGRFRSIGFDVDPRKIAALNAGTSYIRHIASETVAPLIANGQLVATADVRAVRQADIIAICVPTPLTDQREPDLSFVIETVATITRHARPGQLFILESTTYPGTTLEVVRPLFAERGFVGGRDIFIAYSPEREDPGNTSYDVSTIPKIIGGDGADALALAQSFYQSFVRHVVPVSSPATAEAVKLTENVFRAVNIALVNELKVIFSKMGIDIWEVIDAAKTKPFGFTAFYPGPGLGGHCIPIDPFYLAWKARQYGIETRFIELAGEINAAMPAYVAGRLSEELRRRFMKELSGASILLIGVAYKKNVADIRESPALKLMEILETQGANVQYHDPLVPEIPETREHPDLAGRRGMALDPEHIGCFDASVIVTDHDMVEYRSLITRSRLVIDTRGVSRRMGLARDNVAMA